MKKKNTLERMPPPPNNIESIYAADYPVAEPRIHTNKEKVQCFSAESTTLGDCSDHWNFNQAWVITGSINEDVGRQGLGQVYFAGSVTCIVNSSTSTRSQEGCKTAHRRRIREKRWQTF